MILLVLLHMLGIAGHSADTVPPPYIAAYHPAETFTPPIIEDGKRCPHKKVFAMAPGGNRRGRSRILSTFLCANRLLGKIHACLRDYTALLPISRSVLRVGVYPTPATIRIKGGLSCETYLPIHLSTLSLTLSSTMSEILPRASSLPAQRPKPDPTLGGSAPTRPKPGLSSPTRPEQHYESRMRGSQPTADLAAHHWHGLLRAEETCMLRFDLA
ncbi:hypothetical protein B0H11DRAFT_2230129 [Mycena galericulata]|nr:hypothetical protein B0H11DRAFT_2230129 [Mycena galericulata]